MGNPFLVQLAAKFVWMKHDSGMGLISTWIYNMKDFEEFVHEIIQMGSIHYYFVLSSQMVTDDDNQQNTPLHLAVENGSFEVSKMCIEKGAVLHAANKVEAHSVAIWIQNLTSN